MILTYAKEYVEAVFFCEVASVEKLERIKGGEKESLSKGGALSPLRLRSGFVSDHPTLEELWKNNPVHPRIEQAVSFTMPCMQLRRLAWQGKKPRTFSAPQLKSPAPKHFKIALAHRNRHLQPQGVQNQYKAMSLWRCQDKH